MMPGIVNFNQLKQVVRQQRRDRQRFSYEGRTDDVYNFLIAYKTEHDGNSPTLRDIIDNTNITSTSIAHYHLARLEQRGLITMAGAGKTRSIMVTGATWTPPEAANG